MKFWNVLHHVASFAFLCLCLVSCIWSGCLAVCLALRGGGPWVLHVLGVPRGAGGRPLSSPRVVPLFSLSPATIAAVGWGVGAPAGVVDAGDSRHWSRDATCWCWLAPCGLHSAPYLGWKIVLLPDCVAFALFMCLNAVEYTYHFFLLSCCDFVGVCTLQSLCLHHLHLHVPGLLLSGSLVFIYCSHFVCTVFVSLWFVVCGFIFWLI